MATTPLREPVSDETVTSSLRLVDDVEQTKVEAMIPRARLWVEEHTGLALIQRPFSELLFPRGGVVRLNRGPLVSVSGVSYEDSGGVSQTFGDVVASPPSTKLSGSWPATGNGTPYQVDYVAGLVAGEEDPRLIGAMLALIEGEYTAGFAYPPDTITAATNCLFYMKFVAP